MCWCCFYGAETSLACAFCCCPYQCVKCCNEDSLERSFDYQKSCLGAFIDCNQAPFTRQFLRDLDDPNYKLQLWDGARLTAQELRQDMFSRLRKYASPDYPGFIKENVCFDQCCGIMYEKNPSLESQGNDFFRLSAKLNIPAELAVALLSDPQKIGYKDWGLARVQFFHTFPDEKTSMVYTIAPPGGPIAWRDYVDISGWTREEDGSYLQCTTTCCSEEVSTFPGAIRGTNLIFGYRFEPEAGDTRTTLVAQTETGGCLPKCLGNSFFQFFLYLYVQNLEQIGLKMIKAGTAAEFVAQFPGLGPLVLPDEFKG